MSAIDDAEAALVAAVRADDQAVLAALQAEYDAYVASHPDTPPPPPSARFPGDPGGFLRGQSHQGGVAGFLSSGRALQFAQAVGQPGLLYPGLFHIYITPAQSTVAGAQQAIRDALTVKSWGAYPLIDVKEPTGLSLADVVAGQMDDVIDTLLEGAVANDLALTLAFHDEPVGDKIGGVLATPTDYANCIARIGQRRDAAGAQNLVCVTGALGQGSFAGFGGKAANGPPDPWLQALAPVLAKDVWDDHRYLEVVAATPASKWIQPQDLMGPFWDLQDKYAMAELGYLLPRFHGEWGVHTKPDDFTFAPGFMAAFDDYFHSRSGIGDSFFDSPISSANNWVFDLPVNGQPDATRLVTRAHQYAAHGA